MEAVLATLSREQSLRLMATVPVGRIIYTRQAMPAVELVNFIMDAGDIVIRTAVSGKLAAAIRGAIVAFEADEYDRSRRTGWSVTAIGQAREITSSARADRLRAVGPDPWAPGDRSCFLTISPEVVNGRLLSAAGSGLGQPDAGVPPRAR
jgi:uncharacterized protein